ncbi:hypothetical protein AVEN_87417-1 [Araneus ventricosus]|uniref:Tc1-like transposase DDE domain-containing protein n=1 Tax=Araneus ventricosus TaxID=182803 RepID=A0A4Y2W0N3_ARAVE|nr:hypothetical protein AVEN_87417-1 [Araneus ventricosus]
MFQAGARQSTVARELNVHRSVNHRLWNHYQRDQNANRRRGSGRRRITTTADDRYLLQCARRRRTLTERFPKGNDMTRARDILSDVKHRRKRPLQRWRVICLGRDSNERPNRPIRVRWGFRLRCPISRRNPTPSFAAFYRCNGYRLDILWTITPPYRARLKRSYLESETIPQMAWPARSPDLNPIEHVWDMLGRRIAGCSVSPGTFRELQQALLHEWALLPQQAINDTIASMPRRCQACISAIGYHTRY